MNTIVSKRAPGSKQEEFERDMDRVIGMATKPDAELRDLRMLCNGMRNRYPEGYGLFIVNLWKATARKGGEW